MSVVEHLLIEHCAPVIYGAKPAAMFTLSYGAFAQLNEVLKPLLETEVLRENAGRILALVYDGALLERAVSCANAAAILAEYGYASERADTVIRHLKNRLNTGGGFPHEVGLLLGYPPEDVRCFIEGKREHRLCGAWKVYGDENRARKVFAEYRRCRDRMREYLESVNSPGRYCAAG